MEEGGGVGKREEKQGGERIGKSVGIGRRNRCGGAIVIGTCEDAEIVLWWASVRRRCATGSILAGRGIGFGGFAIATALTGLALKPPLGL